MAKKIKRIVEFEELPESCIATILSHTTPIDTCRLSVVSKTFHSASDSDTVWNQFLPSDSNFMDSIISRFPSLANSPSKKALFHVIALYSSTIVKSFQLDKKSGKICYMLSAKSLTIDCKSRARRKKRFIYVPKSRFRKVAKLTQIRELEIHGMINTLSLSPNTEYVAYLVFKMSGAVGFEKELAKLSVGVECGPCITKSVCLNPEIEYLRQFYIHSSILRPPKRLPKRITRLQRPYERNDGWLEIEMGKFFNSRLVDKEVHMSVIQKNVSINHFFLEGIEVRPKEDN